MTSVGQRTASEPPVASRRSRLREWWTPGIVAAALLAGAAVMTSRPWWPTGDMALLQLRLDAMPADFPLVGVYSRFGWWHPGPAFLIFMWLGSALGGAAALLMAIAVLHVAALVGAWWIARGVNLVAAQALLLAGVASLVVRPVDQVLTPWNPYVGLTGVLLLVAAGWALSIGRAAGAVVLLPWGSFLVQSHVGYLPAVAAVLLTAVGLLLAGTLWHQHKMRSRPTGYSGAQATVESASDFAVVPWRALAWGAAISVVMWLPPVAQQITGEPGNLGALVTQLGGQSQGLQAGVATLRAAFCVPLELGPDFAGGLPANASGTPWLVLLPIAATIVALWRRRREQIFAMALIGVALLAGLVSVAGLTPPAFEYLVPWLPSVVLLTFAWSVWVLADPWLGPERWWPIAIGSAAVVTAAIVAMGLATAPPPLAPRGIAANELWSAVAADADGAPITVTGADADEQAASVAQGVAALAAAAGADVALDDVTSSQVERVLPSDGPGRTQYLVRTFTAGQPTPPSQRVVATYDPFTAEQWEEIVRINAQLAQPGLDPVTRLELANQRAEIEQGRRAFQVLTPVA